MRPLGPTVTVEVGELAPGGRAFARLDDGTPLFVQGAWPGERAEVDVQRRRAGVAEGRAVEILVPSPDRVDPPCPWADRCGGCDWMALAVPAQHRAKASLIAQVLQRQANLTVEPPPIVPSPSPLAYRGRIRLHVHADGSIGYFAPGSHDLVAIDRCAIASDDVNRALSTFRHVTAPLGASFGREISGAEICAGDAGSWAIQLFARRRRGGPSRKLATALQDLADTGGAVWLDGTVIHGASTLRVALPGGLTLLAGPSTFVQANPGANRALVDIVVAAVGGPGPFLDLFCGSGNFTLPLLAVGLTGVGVELSHGAVDDARAAASAQDLPASAFIQARLGTDPGSLVSQRTSSVVILDPPRTGARELMPAIAAARPRRVIYVGCDPVTQARDLRVLLDAGYELDPSVEAPLIAVDLFPQTHHVETVATLRPRQE